MFIQGYEFLFFLIEGGEGKILLNLCVYGGRYLYLPVSLIFEPFVIIFHCFCLMTFFCPVGGISSLLFTVQNRHMPAMQQALEII
jgi:hypothetical protein